VHSAQVYREPPIDEDPHVIIAIEREHFTAPRSKCELNLDDTAMNDAPTKLSFRAPDVVVFGAGYTGTHVLELAQARGMQALGVVRTAESAVGCESAVST
jgi:phosphoglycerate dehydrogenase-like enzyme